MLCLNYEIIGAAADAASSAASALDRRRAGRTPPAAIGTALLSL